MDWTQEHMMSQQHIDALCLNFYQVLFYGAVRHTLTWMHWQGLQRIQLCDFVGLKALCSHIWIDAVCPDLSNKPGNKCTI